MAAPRPRPHERQVVAPVDVSVRSVALTILAVAAGMALLHWAQPVFVPIVLSILIAYSLDPVVRSLMRLRLGRAAASAAVVGALTSAIVFTGYALSDDAARIVANLPDAAEKLREAIRPERGEETPIEQVQEAAQEIQRTADEAAGPNPAPPGVQRVQIEEPTIDVRQYVFWGSASLVAFAGQTALVVFFVFFLLASGDLFKRKLVRLAGPSLEKRKITVQILDDINLQIERFLFVSLATSLIVAAATWIAFRLLGLEQAGVWAVAAGIFNNIPYFGPVLVSGGAFVVAFLQFGTMPAAVYVSGAALAITTLEGWLLKPVLMRRTTQINEVAIFVGLIFWSFVWGIWGTLLAVPMLAAVKACCDRVDDLKPIGELLGE